MSNGAKHYSITKINYIVLGVLWIGLLPSAVGTYFQKQLSLSITLACLAAGLVPTVLCLIRKIPYTTSYIMCVFPIMNATVTMWPLNKNNTINVPVILTSVAFMGLAMASLYFNKKLISFYGVYGFIVLTLLYVIFPNVLGKNFQTAIITFCTSSILLFILAKWGIGYIIEAQMRHLILYTQLLPVLWIWPIKALRKWRL